MYSRTLKFDHHHSVLLLGPRATGKSTWVQHELKPDVYIDLLDPGTCNRLLAAPEELETYIPQKMKGWIAIDEIQRVPELLNVVHRLIEKYRYRFVLTGSSARKLRRSGVNLLAGRALTYQMLPFTVEEVGEDFDLPTALKVGMLPSVFGHTSPEKYLASYVQTYLREEVQQEGLTRNIAAFSRFLASAAFSQANLLNISEVARDCAIERKVVEGYFTILEDLLIGHRLPVFTKQAKRGMVVHPKFYYFDVGVYRALRPSGPLDEADVIPGAALETLVFQELRATILNNQLAFDLYYWRTTAGLEVDFIAYGTGGLIAIEVKCSRRVDRSDLRGLLEFRKDFPMAECFLFYGGKERREVEGIALEPVGEALVTLNKLLGRKKFRS